MLPYLLGPAIPAVYLLAARGTYGYLAWHPEDGDTHAQMLAWSFLWPVFWALNTLAAIAAGTGRFVSSGWVARAAVEAPAGPGPGPEPAACLYPPCDRTDLAYGAYCSRDHYSLYRSSRERGGTIAAQMFMHS